MSTYNQFSLRSIYILNVIVEDKAAMLVAVHFLMLTLSYIMI